MVMSHRLSGRYICGIHPLRASPVCISCSCNACIPVQLDPFFEANMIGIQDLFSNTSTGPSRP